MLNVDQTDDDVIATDLVLMGVVVGIIVGAALGWLGTIGTLLAYVLMWRGRVDATTIRYVLLNAVGGMLAAIGALVYGAWPAVASNLIWGLIGVQGLVAALLRKHPLTGHKQISTTARTDSIAPSHPTSSALAWNADMTFATAISLPWLAADPAHSSTREAADHV